MVTLQDLEAFVALAETGSIGRAARRLNLTQPAVTRRIQNFEISLGGPALLDRSIKPAALTPAGRQVLERCRNVLRTVAELEVTDAAAAPAGELRIGIAHGLGQIFLGSPLDDFRRRFPKVMPRITTDWTSRMIEDVSRGALDCAIGFVAVSRALPRGVDGFTLGSEEVIVVGTRSAHGRRRRRRLVDLAAEPWVLHPMGCGIRDALQRAFDRAGIPLQVAAEALEEDLLLSLVGRGVGLGILPRRQFEASPLRSRLAPVMLSDFRLEFGIDLLRRGVARHLTEAVDWLGARVANRLG